MYMENVSVKIKLTLPNLTYKCTNRMVQLTILINDTEFILQNTISPNKYYADKLYA